MTSKLTINLVVALLGITLLGCVGGAIVLSALRTPIPDQLWTVGSTALGSLASVLVSTRAGDVAAAPVQTVVPPEKPITTPVAPVE